MADNKSGAIAVLLALGLILGAIWLGPKKKCPHCGKENDSTSAKCKYCGSKL